MGYQTKERQYGSSGRLNLLMNWAVLLMYQRGFRLGLTCDLSNAVSRHTVLMRKNVIHL